MAVDGGAEDPARTGDLLLTDDRIGQDQAQWQLDDLRHLVGLRDQGGANRGGAHERPQLEVADRDPDVVERAGDADGGGVDADLLVGLAQRGRLAAGVTRIDRASRQRDLARMCRQPGVAQG